MAVALSYFSVVQPNVVDIVTPMTGPEPTTGTVMGIATFTPSVSEIQNDMLDATVFLHPIVGRFTADGHGLQTADGTLGVDLVDNLGLGLATDALTYRVDYWFTLDQQPGSFLIVAPGDGSTIDLNDLVNRQALP